MNIGVIGAGAWGTALAQVLARDGRPVRLWAREADVVTSINTAHENRIFLPGIPLDPAIWATGSLAELAECAALLLLLGALWLALDRLRSGVQTSAPADNWRASDAATEAKARELGMWPARRGESMQNFRDRIAMALKDRGQA